MIFAPVYCSSEPPPASGPVRSKITPILIFFSCAEADTAIPSTAVAAISPPSTRAALTTSIGSLPCKIVFFSFLLLAPITGGAGPDVKRADMSRTRCGILHAAPQSRDPLLPQLHNIAVILRRSPPVAASLEGWSPASGHPSRRRADARLLRMTASLVVAELALVKPSH